MEKRDGYSCYEGYTLQELEKELMFAEIIDLRKRIVAANQFFMCQVDYATEEEEKKAKEFIRNTL